MTRAGRAVVVVSAVGLAGTLCAGDPAGWLRAARSGPGALEVAIAWGPRATWLGPAGADRQQARDGCGAAALAVLLRAHGRTVPQRLLWSITRVRGGGTRLGELARAARCFGVATEIGSDRGLVRVPLPAIVHLRRGHFVVLETRDAALVTVLDPGVGRVSVPLRELRRRASGAFLAAGFREADA